MNTTFLKQGSAQDLMEFIRRMFLEINTAIPGEIITFNSLTQTACVKPCIRSTTITQAGVPVYVDLPGIIEVPCIFPYSTTSGFSLTFPVKPKDQCLIIFSQRSFDGWLISGSVQNPSETQKPRSHQYSDAVAIVGLIPNVNAISQFQTDGIEIRNKNRDSYIKIMDSQIIIHEGENHVAMAIDGSMTAKHALTQISITTDGKLTIETPTELSINSVTSKIQGDVEVTGNQKNTGDVEITGEQTNVGNIDASSFSVSGQAGATGSHEGLSFVNGLCVSI